MATANPIGDHPANAPRMPWYARTAATAGRPLVLATALLMCVPAERYIAKLVGWRDPYATGMPLVLSAYAGIAAVVAANRPKGTRGRVSAVVGASVAIALALAAQVISHLVSTGHMEPNQAWLVAVVSAVPPAVAAHLLHLAATPATRASHTAPPAVTIAPTPVAAPAVGLPPKPAHAPAIAAAVPAAKPQRASVTAVVPQYDPARQAIRDLYDRGRQPGTKEMQAAVHAAAPRADGKLTAGSTVRYWRKQIEEHEGHLAKLPRSNA